MILVDESQEEIITNTFYYSGGLKDFVEYLNEDKSPIHPEVIYFEGEKDGIKSQIGIQYTDSYTESIFSYVNNIPTRKAACMKPGLRQPLPKCLMILSGSKIFTRKNGGLTGEDFREA